MGHTRDEIEIRADAGWEGRLETKLHMVRGAEYSTVAGTFPAVQFIGEHQFQRC